MSSKLEFCVPEVGGAGIIAKLFHLTSPILKKEAWLQTFMFIFLGIQLLLLKNGEHYTRRKQHKDGSKWWRDSGTSRAPNLQTELLSLCNWRALRKSCAPRRGGGHEQKSHRQHKCFPRSLREPMQLDLRVQKVSLEGVSLFHTNTKSSVSHVSRKVQEFRTDSKANPG